MFQRIGCGASTAMSGDGRVRADVMLACMSNIRSGVISELRERFIWLARVDDINPSRPEANRWLNAMSALGHVEVDWSRGTWAMACWWVCVTTASCSQLPWSDAGWNPTKGYPGEGPLPDPTPYVRPVGRLAEKPKAGFGSILERVLLRE